MPSFTAQFAPLPHEKQFPKSIQEFDVQHMRAHTDKTHKQPPAAAMSLRVLPRTLGMSPVWKS